jgi:hypothetical protein
VSEETTAAVETPAAVESSAPVEAAPAVEAAPVEDAAPAAEDPSVINWNGELDGIKEAEWFSGLEENVRSGILGGLETKYRNWQRGYTKAFQDNASRRKELDGQQKAIRDQEIRVQKWLHGDINPIEDKQRELDELKTAHEVALNTLRAEYGENTEKLKTAHSSELDSLRQEREEIGTKLKSFEESAAKAEASRVDAVVQEFETWLTSNAPEIIANDEAYYTLCALVGPMEIPLESAVSMVRAGYTMADAAQAAEPVAEAAPTPAPEPVPEPARPEEPSAAVDLMNMGTGAGGGTSAGEARSYEQIMDQMRRNAQGVDSFGQ